MKFLKVLSIIILVFPLLIFAENNQSLPAPPPPVIKIPPPKNLDEAIERIPDYFKLIEILPPVINKQKFFKEFFGNYSDFISFLVENQQNIEELEKLSSTKEGRDVLKREFENFIKNKKKETRINKAQENTYKNKNEMFIAKTLTEETYSQNIENFSKDNKQTLYENSKLFSKQKMDTVKNKQNFSIKQILLISLIILIIFVIFIIKLK